MITIINNKLEPLKAFEGFCTLCCDVQDINKQKFRTSKPVYFVSPANSKLYMDGGIDASYCKMFPGIQLRVQTQMRSYSQIPTSLVDIKYLPVGGALLNRISDDYYLIAAPTMLSPQNVKNTNNAYYAMKAILKVWPGNGTLIVPLLCGGVGMMSPENISKQIKKAIDEYNVDEYKHELIYIPNESYIMNEQPKVYENSEFIKIEINKIVNTDVNMK